MHKRRWRCVQRRKLHGVRRCRSGSVGQYIQTHHHNLRYRIP